MFTFKYKNLIQTLKFKPPPFPGLERVSQQGGSEGKILPPVTAAKLLGLTLMENNEKWSTK